MNENDIKIAALQETKLTSKSKDPNTADFTLVRKDRNRDKGGGLAFLIHKTIQFKALPNSPCDTYMESQAISVGETNIVNIYIPPNSSCSNGYNPTLNDFLHMKDTLILGDFNAHDPLWFSPLSDDRGRLLADEIGNSDFGVINEDSPTRLPSNGPQSSPDISLASLALLPYITWETKTEMGSDHLPITIKIETEIKQITSDIRIYINFKKADWTAFQTETEVEFAKLTQPNDVHDGELALRKIITK